MVYLVVVVILVRRQIRRSDDEDDSEEDEDEHIEREDIVILTDKNGMTDAMNVESIVMNTDEIFL